MVALALVCLEQTRFVDSEESVTSDSRGLFSFVRETQRRAPHDAKHTNYPDRDVLQRDTCYRHSHGS